MATATATATTTTTATITLLVILFLLEADLDKVVLEEKPKEDEIPNDGEPESDYDESDTGKTKQPKKKARTDFVKLREKMSKDMPKDKIQHWLDLLDRTYRAHIQLMVEPPSSTQLADKLKSTDVWRMRGVSGSSYFGVFYCYASAAESTISPDRRSSPYQDSHATRVVHAVLEARNDKDGDRHIAAGDMYFFNDNFKYGLGPRFLNLMRWAGEVAEGEKRVPKSQIITYPIGGVIPTPLAANYYFPTSDSQSWPLPLPPSSSLSSLSLLLGGVALEEEDDCHHVQRRIRSRSEAQHQELHRVETLGEHVHLHQDRHRLAQQIEEALRGHESGRVLGECLPATAVAAVDG